MTTVLLMGTAVLKVSSYLSNYCLCEVYCIGFVSKSFTFLVLGLSGALMAQINILAPPPW